MGSPMVARWVAKKGDAVSITKKPMMCHSAFLRYVQWVGLVIRESVKGAAGIGTGLASCAMADCATGISLHHKGTMNVGR